MGNFFDFDRAELTALVGRASTANRLFRAVYREGLSLPGGLPEPLALTLPVIADRFPSADGTIRYLIRFSDGEAIESVLIPEDGRVTFCVSSQVGCALACTFCLTGRLGLTRNLAVAEMVGQVLLLHREAVSVYAAARCSVVFMGMGEPLQNYENVMKAVRILHDDYGLSVPLHRITVSTAGLLPGLVRLGEEPLFPNVSISLTGVTNARRDELMPINRKYPLDEVVRTIRAWPAARQKRIMLEYVMIDGVTDGIEDARTLAALVKGIRLKVNLIPLNFAPELPYRPSCMPSVLEFHRVLLEEGVATFIRKTRGQDVSGACGQLRRSMAALPAVTAAPQ